MSTGMTFGQRRFNPTPPEKGSFPLDHEGECKGFMIKYLQCLRKKDFENATCRQESKDYLQCRMEHKLMAKEEWKKLGYEDIEKKSEKNT
ncbi:cytochrome c oxidase assembly protein COX19-like [Lineus longissimus]|uniref:cytochrome c oxidase assembly protein COX19-like n=1 Tax=Lineus longissimus TaxID=88925 RepID=UPI002B4CA8B7